MRLVLVVSFWAFAADASAQICSAEGDATVVGSLDGILERLVMTGGTIVGVDEGERRGSFVSDDAPPCGPCREDGTQAGLSGAYHSYLFQYYAAFDAPADAEFVLANDVMGLIFSRSGLAGTDDPGIVPALLSAAGDRPIESGDVVTVRGRTITLHFESAELRGLDHVRVLTLPGGDCSAVASDAGGLDAGSVGPPDGGVGTPQDARVMGGDATIGRRDGGGVSRADSGSKPSGTTGLLFEGGGGCACDASDGGAGFVSLALPLLGLLRRRRDSR